MITRFRSGHAAHPDWRIALSLAAVQIETQPTAADETLGLVYFTDHYAAHAEALLGELQKRWPQLQWAGCAAVGVMAANVAANAAAGAATNRATTQATNAAAKAAAGPGGSAKTAAEYIDEPALALMLCALPPSGFELFSGTRPIDSHQAHTALVHADPGAADLGELVVEMSERTQTGYLFGGVVSSRSVPAQVANGVLRGGLSGVAFGGAVGLVSRVTQGCQPIGPARVITSAERNLVIELDGQPALPALLADLGITLDAPREAMLRLRNTLVGLSDALDPIVGRGAQFGANTRVRHLVGLDPGRQAVAVGDIVEPGMRLAFCERDVNAARRDLVRVCSEIRDELGADPDNQRAERSARGALYISCTGRGGAHFGAPSAEAQIVQHALGDVPLVGFFAAGEIARHHLYGYTGVLTVFTGPA